MDLSFASSLIARPNRINATDPGSSSTFEHYFTPVRAHCTPWQQALTAYFTMFNKAGTGQGQSPEPGDEQPWSGAMICGFVARLVVFVNCVTPVSLDWFSQRPSGCLRFFRRERVSGVRLR